MIIGFHELNTNPGARPLSSTGSRMYLPALLGTELIPILVESAFVLSLITIAVVIRMQKLTPVQFFWLVAMLLCIFFVVTMMLYVRYS